MTINELFDELENKARDTYIVTLKYKYDFEENYTIENCVLEYDSITDSYVWLNDWYEGQTDVEVLGYMILGDVDTTKLLTCEDCISREGVLYEAKYYADRPTDTFIKDVLKQLPSVQPQPKRGKWIYDGDCIICNKCLKAFGWISMNMVSNFCPNCGADMTESEDEDASSN